MAVATETLRITPEQIRTLHGLAAHLGILERGNRDDDFHALIYAQTGKYSTKDLTQSEYHNIHQRLRGDLTNSTRPDPPGRGKTAAKAVEGKMSPAQVKKATKLMFILSTLSPSETPYRTRMRGIIQRSTGMDIPLRGDMFAWLSYKQGYQLIECLKNMVEQNKMGGG